MQNGYFRFFLMVLLVAGLSFEMRAEEGSEAVEPGKTVQAEGGKSAGLEQPDAKLSDDGKVFEMPGVKVMIEEKYVDAEVKVCLVEGLLELLVCAKDTKEHEAVFVLETKAQYVHAGLLLIGAKPGSPAMRKPIEGRDGEWVDILPSGNEVDVYLVVKDAEGKEVERPISQFLMKADPHYVPSGELGEDKRKREPFPTHTFLFAGSHIYKEGDAPARYLAEVDGNVISLSTFGDEMLCLPGIHGHGNDSLTWEVDNTHLPALGEKAIMRLKPKLGAGEPEKKVEEK